MEREAESRRPHPLELTEWAALGLGIAGGIAALQVPAPWLGDPARVALGFGLFLDGLSPALVGKPGLIYRIFLGEGEASLYPWLWALSFTMAGLTLAASGILPLIGAQAAFMAALGRRPGTGLLILALIALPAGAALGVGRRAWLSSWQAFLATLPRRFAGILLLLVGLTLVILGVLETAAPQSFHRLLAAALGPFNPFAGPP
jgi:hypothetical protein